MGVCWCGRATAHLRSRSSVALRSELATVGNDFAEQQLAFPFRADAPNWMRVAINTAITDALTDGSINQLYRTYFAPPASCVDVPNSITLKEGLGLTELSGIFIAGA